MSVDAAAFEHREDKIRVAPDSGAIRASVGVGLMWASPFGPIRIDYAIPVKKQDQDDVQEFNFGISTRF